MALASTSGGVRTKPAKAAARGVSAEFALELRSTVIRACVLVATSASAPSSTGATEHAAPSELTNNARVGTTRALAIQEGSCQRTCTTLEG